MRFDTIKLSELAAIQTGPFGSQLHKEDYVVHGTPIVTVEHLGSRKFTEQNLPCVSDKDKERLKKYVLKTGDIVFSRVGSVDRCSYVSAEYEGWMFSGRCLRVRPCEKLNPEYLYYFFLLEETKQFVRNIATGATMPSINTKFMGEIPIRVPSLETQNKFASILWMIDDKIELNEKVNNNLEQQMQALFNEYLSSNKFYDLTTVKDVVLSANTGADAIQKAPIVDYDTGIRCIRVGDMTNNRSFHDWGFTKVTDDVFKRYQLHKDDIVVTRTASLGLNTIISEDLPAVYNNGLIRLTVNTSNVLPLYLFRQFQTEDFSNYIACIESETSVRPNMKINYLLKYEFVLPPITKQNEIIALLTPMLNQQNNLIVENKHLEALRDTLLSKLMSGELDVYDIDL